MDNRLGDGYGKDYCKQLKADPWTADFKNVLVSVADGWLAKPFDIAASNSLVQRLC
jgi:hypothetical protein